MSQAELVRKLLATPAHIRNISVIAHVDHGKTTLTDSLVSAAGMLSVDKTGKACIMDIGDEEKERGITIQSTGISLPFTRRVVDKNPHFNPNWPAPAPAPDAPEQKDEAEERYESFLINLIDSPGHVDFSSEVSAALRLTDGGLVVVDCVESVCVQTKTVLRQAIAERVRVVLFLNKLDRMFLELQKNPEETYQAIRRAIEDVNAEIGTYTPSKDPMGDTTVWPQNASVGFGSGLQGWGFTLETFARIYHSKFNMSCKKMMKKLWGDNFYDSKTKKWLKQPINSRGKKLQRAFVQFVLKPVQTMIKAAQECDIEKVQRAFNNFNVTRKLPPVDDLKEMRAKDRLAVIMRTWLPCGEVLRDMIVDRLPDPATAQKYRVQNLYAGPLDDAAATAIRQCDANGEVMMYISKMAFLKHNSRFYAVGRVFSGTLKPGMEVRIQGPEYTPGDKTDLFVKKVSGVSVMMGGSQPLSLGGCPAGGLCALVGIDKYLVKAGTITTIPTAHNFVSMKYSVAPIVRVAVEPKSASQLAKLTLGLQRLSKADPLVQVFTSPTGEHIVAGSGELHIEVCLNALTREYMTGVEIKVSEPVVPFRETVSVPSPQQYIGKSPNKHNRLHMTAEPLDAKLTTAIDDLEVKESDQRVFVTDYKWDAQDARKLWCFGGPDSGRANVLVDQTKGVAYLNDIKDSVISAFSQCMSSGVLTEEPLRGCRFNLHEAKVHPDAPHRGAGQIMQCTRAAVFACQLGSSPRLLEPMYRADIMVPQQFISGAYSTLRMRRAVIVGTEDDSVDHMRKVTAFLPVQESFGFSQLLAKNTSGQAFPQLTFDHWAEMPGDPEDLQSSTGRVIAAIRERKGLKKQLPVVNDYHTKL